MGGRVGVVCASGSDQSRAVIICPIDAPKIDALVLQRVGTIKILFLHQFCRFCFLNLFLSCSWPCFIFLHQILYHNRVLVVTSERERSKCLINKKIVLVNRQIKGIKSIFVSNEIIYFRTRVYTLIYTLSLSSD